MHLISQMGIKNIDLIASPSFEWVTQKNKNSFPQKHDSTGLVTQEIETQSKQGNKH